MKHPVILAPHAISAVIQVSKQMGHLKLQELIG